MAIGKILEKIASIQAGGEEHFPPGLFPAYRSNPLLAYRRADTNLFFSVISAFTLQKMKPRLGADSLEKLVDSITAGIVANFPRFQNKGGLKTYNFWQTRPSAHFPHGYLLRRLEHFRLPDDVDDTCMVYLAGSPTSEELHELKKKLALHANGGKRWAKNTYPEYRRLRAYSTWFGEKMYMELDACVLSNLMFCICYYRLPFDEYDRNSLYYIRSVIETGRYKTEPFRCAHHYPRTPLIIYHVARLIGEFDPPELRAVKPELIGTAADLLRGDIHPMDRVILSTALLRMGQKPEPIAAERYSSREFEGFWFFIAGLLTGCEKQWVYKIAGSRLFHIYWECEAHCWTLLAEYVVLRDA